MERDTASAVAEGFGLGPVPVREDIPLSGSPARTVSRIAVGDARKNVFIVEEIAEASVGRKRAIARTVARLRAADPDIPVPTYLECAPGETVIRCDGRYFQVIPYVPGVPLDRESYLEEGWRGPAMAGFLLRMRRAAKRSDLDRRPESEPFFLRGYVRDIAMKMGTHDGETLSAVRPALDFLESGYFAREGDLPVSFCHGDYHPVNIIWETDGIAGVIDWEFSGPKPELYDVANMVGCLGMEDPAILAKPIVTAFLSTLRETGDFSETSWRQFPDLVIALRFAWLSEWLRFGESDMVSLEIAYMRGLLGNRDALARIWGMP